MATKAQLERRINGLREDIRILQEEVSEDFTENWGSYYPTLEGKVNAILEHLGLDVKVQRRCTKIVVTKKGKK